MSALRIVISVLEERGDTAGLARLEAALPEESEARGAAQESLVAAKLAQLHAVWAAGGQLEAWVRLVELYRGCCVQAQEARLQPRAAQQVRARCRQYARLYIEEAVLRGQGDLRKPIQLGCHKVATDHGDPSLLLLLWEAYFFSGQFEQEEYAELVLDSVPDMADQLDIERVLERCHRYRSERNYDRLLQMSLKRQCPPFIQSRVFEAKLQHQVQHGNLAGAGETVKCAKSLDIRITADYLQMYVRARAEHQLRPQGLMARIKNMFSSSVKNKFS